MFCYLQINSVLIKKLPHHGISARRITIKISDKVVNAPVVKQTSVSWHENAIFKKSKTAMIFKIINVYNKNNMI